MSNVDNNECTPSNDKPHASTDQQHMPTDHSDFASNTSEKEFLQSETTLPSAQFELPGKAVKFAHFNHASVGLPESNSTYSTSPSHTLAPPQDEETSNKSRKHNLSRALSSIRHGRVFDDLEQKGLAEEIRPKEINIPSQRRLNFQHLKRSSSAEKKRMPQISRIIHFFRFRALPRYRYSDLNPSANQYFIPPRDSRTSFSCGLGHFFNHRFVDSVVWKLRTTWSNFIVLLCAEYVIFVNMFALLLQGVSHLYHKQGKGCHYPFKMDDGAGFAENFEVAFSLSWTTFSTVGYGAVGPDPDEVGCLGVRYLCCLEAFFGVIFFGFCSAIFFNRIGRLLSEAKVTFSSSLCIQYGMGVEGDEIFDEHIGTLRSHSSISKPHIDSNPPYPVLEFRIVNDRGNEKGWEILDASLTCMVSTFILASSMPNRKSSMSVSPDSDTIAYGGEQEKVSFTKRTFEEFKITGEKHPYFRTVWYCRHILDKDSPFLKEEVRNEIRAAGNWPTKRKTHNGVRDALVRFENIILTLHGNSCITADSVFAEHRYKFEDIHVGWQFAGMLYRSKNKKDEDRKLKVDNSLIHDILPQNGGGHEQLW